MEENLKSSLNDDCLINSRFRLSVDDYAAKVRSTSIIKRSSNGNFCVESCFNTYFDYFYVGQFFAKCRCGCEGNAFAATLLLLSPLAMGMFD